MQNFELWDENARLISTGQNYPWFIFSDTLDTGHCFNKQWTSAKLVSRKKFIPTVFKFDSSVWDNIILSRLVRRHFSDANFNLYLIFISSKKEITMIYVNGHHQLEQLYMNIKDAGFFKRWCTAKWSVYFKASIRVLTIDPFYLINLISEWASIDIDIFSPSLVRVWFRYILRYDLAF